MKAVFGPDGKFKSLVGEIVNSGHTTVTPVFSSDETVVEVTKDQADSLLKKQNPTLSDLI